MSQCQPFRLFDLPREIRDLAYAEMITLKRFSPERLKSCDHTHYWTPAPQPELMRISKRFSAEYADVFSKRRGKLIVTSDFADEFHIWAPPSTIPCHLMKYLTLYMHVQCFCDHMDPEERQELLTMGVQCDGVDMLEFYEAQLQQFLLHFAGLESLYLKFGVWGAEGKAVEWPIPSHTPQFLSALEKFTRLPCVKSIHLVKCPRPADYQHFCREAVSQWDHKFTGRSGRSWHQLKRFATWTGKDGWQGGDDCDFERTTVNAILDSVKARKG